MPSNEPDAPCHQPGVRPATSLPRAPQPPACRAPSPPGAHAQGVICLEEFGQLMDESSARSGSRPLAPMRVRHIFGTADINHNGVVDFNEFCYAQQRKAKKSRSRRSSPSNSVAGSSIGDETPRSWPNASPRTWPTPPMTPRDLDSPRSHASSRDSPRDMLSCASTRSGSTEGGSPFVDGLNGFQTSDGSGSSPLPHTHGAASLAHPWPPTVEGGSQYR